VKNIKLFRESFNQSDYFVRLTPQEWEEECNRWKERDRLEPLIDGQQGRDPRSSRLIPATFFNIGHTPYRWDGIPYLFTGEENAYFMKGRWTSGYEKGRWIRDYDWYSHVGKSKVIFDKKPNFLVFMGIIKTSDEYFLVNYNRNFFKCDQWEGLMELFKWLFKSTW
jgi:hypothetical protein